MKLKLFSKREEKQEDKPQKGFEEFNIDKEVLEELDAIEETSENTNETNEIEIVNEEEKKNEVIDASSVEFINIVRENINNCAKDIKEISDTMQKIESQKNSESFWKKGENIRTISKNVNKMSEVQQKTLDLLVMFLGASGKMADDYDTILKTIDELGEVNGGEVEVLDYLLKIKKMVKEIKSNDERLKEIIFKNDKLNEKIESLEKKYNEKVTTFEKNSKIVYSRVQNLKAKNNRLSLFMLLSYVLIIALAVLFYFKVMR